MIGSHCWINFEIDLMHRGIHFYFCKQCIAGWRQRSSSANMGHFLVVNSSHKSLISVTLIYDHKLELSIKPWPGTLHAFWTYCNETFNAFQSKHLGLSTAANITDTHYTHFPKQRLVLCEPRRGSGQTQPLPPCTSAFTREGIAIRPYLQVQSTRGGERICSIIRAGYLIGFWCWS